MEVSDNCQRGFQTEEEPGGQALIEKLVVLTGLPDLLVRPELDQIIENAGQSSNHLTLEQLRSALVSYLEGLQADFVSEDLQNSE